jgi:hypothetical protein
MPFNIDWGLLGAITFLVGYIAALVWRVNH